MHFVFVDAAFAACPMTAAVAKPMQVTHAGAMTAGGTIAMAHATPHVAVVITVCNARAFMVSAYVCKQAGLSTLLNAF
jgi:hypothetical protein